MSTLERLLSDNMYKEQSWIEKLLKRMRNEADTQAQSFHTYLVDQLLSVANAILASVKNQGQTVGSLATKVDKHVSTVLPPQRGWETRNEKNFSRGLDGATRMAMMSALK